MMKKGIAKFTAFCLTAGLTFGGTGIVSLATGADISLVGIGGTVKGNKTEAAVSGETSAVTAEDTEAEKTSETQSTSAEEAVETEVETEAPLDTSMVNTTGFAKYNEYVNIRATGDTEGEVLGKLYNNAAVYILGVDEHGWYRVKSGNVEGYVASQYIATGAAAESLANEVGYNVAEVGAEVLNVRASASQDSEVVATVTEADEIEVVEDCGEWLKVALSPDCYGYVSVDYVNAETQYKVAESIEEEQARLAEEQAAAEAAWLEYLAQQEAEQAAAEQAYLDAIAAQQAAEQQAAWDAEYQAQQAQQSADAAAQQTADAQAQADAAYQEYLDAQSAADAATQQADADAVAAAAAQAQAEYQEFLNAQAAADAQAQAEADAAAQAQAAADAAAQAQAEADAAAQQQVTDTTTDTSTVEDTSSSSSTLGQSIVNFATQFVGNPYVWGGTSLTNGADCSGFTQSVMANFGISIPRTAAAQSGSGTPVDLSEIQPGDLLFYSGDGGIGHVTIYMGNGQVVHASNPSTGITISSYGYRTPVSARRYW